MGSSSSKPSGSSAPQVWNSATSVSHDLSSALQTSPESNTSRQQAIELEIQARVAAELKRLRAEEASSLKEAQQKLSESTNQQVDEPKVTRQTVSKEVDALRAKLQERRQVRGLPESVEAARNEVVRCLRENDRRPLDCWKEVEAFKEEVRRLEKGWVDKVVS